MSYELHDVLQDREAAEEFLKLGGRLPPLLRIGDRVIEGFRPDEIEAALDAFLQPEQEQEETDGRDPEGT